MVIPPGGERIWIDLTSSGLREETAGHLIGVRFNPPQETTPGVLLHCYILIFWYIGTFLPCSMSGVAMPLFPWEQLCPALSVCAPSAGCRLAQGASAVFHCPVKKALVKVAKLHGFRLAQTSWKRTALHPPQAMTALH